MHTVSMLKFQARALSLQTGARHTQCLQFVGRKAGFSSFESAGARLPQSERDLVAASAVRIEGCGAGYGVTSGDYRVDLPWDCGRQQLIGHCAWLLGVPAAASARAVVSRDGFEATIADVEDTRRPWDLTADMLRHAIDQLRRELQRERVGELDLAAGLDRLSALEAKPWRADVHVRRDAHGVHADLPWLVAHHSPTGWEWGYGASGPADLALNIATAWVPPLTDGLEPEALHREQWTSSTAWRGGTGLRSMISTIPTSGGPINAQLVGEVLHEQQAVLMQADLFSLRCADDLSFFAWTPPAEWIHELQHAVSVGRPRVRP